jgi:diacylglycerol kinase family enzyme
LATYVRKTLKNFIISKSYPFILQVNGKNIELNAFFINIANSNQFGNHFTIAPKASLTDGQLDIVIMTRQNKMSMLLQTVRQVAGYNRLQKMEVLNERSGVIYFQIADEFTIHNHHLAPLHIDGDPVNTAKKIQVRMLKSCFRLIYP